MSRALAALLGLLCAGVVACPSFDYEGGRFACESDEDCPVDAYCDTDVGGCEFDDGGGGSGSGGGCSNLCADAHAVCSQFDEGSCNGFCNSDAACRDCLAGTSCVQLSVCPTRCGIGGA